jgi:hypothetical protein
VRLESRLVRRQAEPSGRRFSRFGGMERRSAQLEDVLKHSLRGGGVEVREFDRRGLLKEGFALEVGGDELRALGGVFFVEVAADCAALVEDEAIVFL